MEKTIACQYCGKTVIKIGKPSYFKRHGHTNSFCSPTCRNKARILANIPCPTCGKLFKPKCNRGKGKGRQRYCSQRCGAIARPHPGYPGHPSSRKTPTHIVELVRTVYPTQGAEPLMQSLKMTRQAIRMIAYKNGIRLDPYVYHDRVHKSARRYMQTTKNPSYRTGVTCQHWGKNWLEQRKAARQRDHSICQVCFTSGRSVHHIIPRRFFLGHMEDSNKLSNLITLCASCHKFVENGQIPCPIPK